jgi:4-hydroxybenzoate polyprenyltransferase/phosphoserine phosphatase
MDAAPILFVDLDGTLIRSDLTVETLLAFLLKHPLNALQIPVWLLRGRSVLKRELAERTTIDVETLPYNETFLKFLESERGKRTLVLATASDRILAERVAQYLKIFSDVIGSEPGKNMKGKSKLAVMQRISAGRAFAYAGNSRVDLPIFEASNESIVVSASKWVETRAKEFGNVSTVIPRQNGQLLQFLRALRPHHWLKNALVFVPLLTAHVITDPRAIGDGILAFGAFCLTASSVYLVNDLLDLQADRYHLWKKKRPIPSGQIGFGPILAAIPLLLIGAAICSWFLPEAFRIVLLSYFVSTALYSFWLKQVPIVDIVILSGLYTLRIMGGIAAADVAFSPWLLAFSIFFFFSLALVKRMSELVAFAAAAETELHGRRYLVSDQPLLLAMGIASSQISVVIMALYVSSDHVRSLYARPEFLWLICPLLLAFVSRMWLLATRGRIRQDPVLFLIKDIASIIFVALSIAVMAFAA